MASVLVAAIAAPTADKYPAGLNPNLCPNYPHCDNALLAAHSQSAGQVGHAASYQTPASTYPLAGAYPGYAGYVNQGLGAYVGHPAGVYGGHSGGSYAAHG